MAVDTVKVKKENDGVTEGMIFSGAPWREKQEKVKKKKKIL